MSQSLSILLIRFSSLGDVILTTPLIASLREMYPEARIDLVVAKEYAALMEQVSGLTNVISFDKSSGLAGLVRLRKSLAKHPYDHVLDLHGNLRSRLLRIGLGRTIHTIHKRTRKRWLLVKFKLNSMAGEPDVVGRYYETGGSLGVVDKGDAPHLPFVDERDPKLIVIAPGSRHWNKRWPQEYFIELCNSLIAKGYAIELHGSQAERETANAIATAAPGVRNLTGTIGLVDVARRFSQASRAITNDSGLMHIAEAVGTPVVAMFGPTVTDFGFAPRSKDAIVLEVDGLYCRPCTAIGREDCPEKHFRCMLEITPQMTLAAVPLFTTTDDALQ